MNKLLPLLAFSVLLLIPAGAQNAFAHGSIDQSNPAPPFNGAAVLISAGGQEFQPTVSNIVAVDLFFSPTVLPRSSTITVDIRNSFNGAILGTTSQLVITPGSNTPANPLVVHFDLDVNGLSPGNTYVIQAIGDNGDYSWVCALNSYPNGQNVRPGVNVNCDQNFVTYFSSAAPVGGESLSIDSTALILAGAQSFSWMIPVVLSGIGIGLFVVSRKSENS